MPKIFVSIYKSLRTLLLGHGLLKLYPVRAIHILIFSHLKSNLVEAQGHKMFLDSKDSLRLSIYGVHEPFETELVKKEIRDGDVVLDIGANIGYYTLIFAKLVGEKGNVFAFEPDPTNFALLKKNVEINGYQNVILVQKAVSNKTEKTRLYLSEDNKADHKIYDAHDGRQSIEIEAIRLDDYFKDYDGRIDFIKMDIEGAEASALQGALNLLKKNKNVKLVTEFWPSALKKSGAEPGEYLNLLIELGFSLYHLNEKEKKIEPIDASESLKTHIIEQKNAANLLCVRSVKTGKHNF